MVRAEVPPTKADVTFASGGAQLSGTLALPPREGPHPVVVLLHGASWGLRSFYTAFVEVFVESGVGCFAFDRRGEGDSTGSSEQDIFAFAEDAVAAWEAVRDIRGVDPARIGLWGYSNGAWVATLAAARLPECAFLLLTGASGVSPAESEAFRRTEDLRLQGIAPPTLEAVERTWTIVFDYLGHGVWDDAWDDELPALARRLKADSRLYELPVPEMVKANPALDSVPRFESPLFHDIKGRLRGINPGMAFDPIPSLRAVKCPVFVLLAEHDRNLPTPESARRFGEVARERGDGSVRIEVMPGVGHQFGISPEVPNAPPARGDFAPGYLEMMAAWLAVNARVKA